VGVMGGRVGYLYIDKPDGGRRVQPEADTSVAGEPKMLSCASFPPAERRSKLAFNGPGSNPSHRN